MHARPGRRCTFVRGSAFVLKMEQQGKTYGTLPTTTDGPLLDASRPGRARKAVALVAGFLVVAAAARSRTRATATALDEMGDVCLVHVAVGDTFEEVSTYTLPSKLAYAEKYGYRVMHYAATPTCCNDIDSYACTLSTVQYKYCALRDALTTGGSQSASGSSGPCKWVFITDGDALFTPDAPSLDTLVPDPDSVAILSAGTEIYTPSLTTQTLESGLFNSGAMIWRNTDRALAAIDAVLHFDDDTYEGKMGCADAAMDGVGDQWALCGAGAQNPSIFDGFAAWMHPTFMQRTVQFADGQLAEDQLIDWPPLTGDGFVVNCCGDDPLGCVKFLREYYTDAP